MWTSTITHKEYTGGTLSIGVTYTNGVSTFTETYSIVNSDTLAQIVQNRLTALAATDGAVSSLSLNGAPPTLKAAVATSPNAFSVALDHLRHYNNALTLGLITSSDGGYVSALSSAQGLYTAAFVDTI